MQGSLMSLFSAAKLSILSRPVDIRALVALVGLGTTFLRHNHYQKTTIFWSARNRRHASYYQNFQMVKTDSATKN